MDVVFVVIADEIAVNSEAMRPGWYKSCDRRDGSDVTVREGPMLISGLSDDWERDL
jgi:hypothetical protein